MTSKKHVFMVAFLTVVMILAFSASASAINANSEPFPFTQPNGTVLAVRLFGDEFLHWEEDSNGGLIVFDEALDGYCAGVWTDEGAVSTGELVGSGLSTVMFKPATHEIPAAVLAQAAAFREEATAGMFDDEIFVQAMAEAMAADPGTPPVHASIDSLKRDMLMIHVTFEDRSNILTSSGQVMPKMSGQQIYDLCFGLRGEVERSVNCYYQDLFMTDEIVITPPEVLVPMDGYQGVIEVVMPGQHPHWGSNDAPSMVFMRDAMVKACAENLVDLTKYDKNKDGSLARDELAIGMIIDGFEYSMGNIRPNFWGVSTSTTPAANLTQGVKIASLFAQGAFHRNSGNVYSDAGTAGVIVHEMGHSGYSFQDTYDTGGLSASSGGLGYWSMQASGDNGRLAGEFAGMTSGYQCAYNMVRSGIVRPGTAAYGEKVVIENHLDIYLVQTPIVTPVESTPAINLLSPNYRGQYFLLQQRKWGETFNYDRGAFAYINASSNESTGGILIQHVDLNVPTNRISCKPGHYRAGYEEAHGGTQHMQGRSGPTERRGDLGDLWGVTKHEFSLRSDPKSGIYAHDDGRVWVNALTPQPHQNTPAGITLTNIQWDPATFSTSFILQAPTYENLYLSVQGETNAAAAYRAFAAKAQEEGYAAIATLFTATADAEAKHAEDEWAVLVSLGATDRPVADTPAVGTTLQNLATAFAGETYEYTVMYPAFLAQAQEDGIAAAERIFTFAMKAEEVHAGNYADVLALLTAGDAKTVKNNYSVVYRCPVCGEVVTTLPAGRCPICGAAPSSFIEYTTYYEYSVWLETAQENYNIGDTIYVDVMLKGDINYVMTETKITYDAELLEYVGYENLNAWMGQIYKENPNIITTRNIANINMNVGLPCLEDVKLVTLKFKVADYLPIDDFEVAFGFAAANVYAQPDVVDPLNGPEFDLPVILSSPTKLTGDQEAFLALLDYDYADYLSLYLSKQIGNRITFSARRDMAVDWIASEFASYGYTPEVKEFTASGNGTVDGLIWIDGKHYVYYGPAYAASTVYKYNDAASLEITGAAVVNWANSGNALVLPTGADYTDQAVFVVCNSSFPNNTNAYNAALALQNAGAAAVMFQTLPMAANGNTTYSRIANTTSGTDLTIPVGSVLNYETAPMLSSLDEDTEVSLTLRYGVQCKNVIARIPSATGSKKTIYVTSHHDTTGSGPGMNDNGSGVIMCLEMARAWKDYAFDCNIVFVIFDSEESGGMRGATNFVTNMTAEERAYFVADYNMDMIATSQANCEWMFMNISDSRLNTLQGQIPTGNNNALADNPAAVAIAKEYNFYNTTMKAAKKMDFEDHVLFAYDTTTDHIVFFRNGMTNAVEYDWRSNRRGTGFETLYHRAGDTYELNFSLDRLQRQADIISLAILFEDQGK